MRTLQKPRPVPALPDWRADERPADPVDDVPAAWLRVDELARERAQLATFGPGIEVQAQATARAAFLELFRPAVAKLLAAHEVAKAADMAVADLWADAEASGVPLPSFRFLPPLRPEVRRSAAHPAAGNLAAWRQAAGAFLAEGDRR